ncbi:MAG: hypothetical protein KG012_11810 [Deltaproteobacteria bacterium]|nr:hypothetical protein [Deltaproteobacteria bacterium]
MDQLASGSVGASFSRALQGSFGVGGCGVYLLELTRYIHLNPVRAGIVKEPEDYLWGGHRAYLGREVIPWLTTDWVFSQFSKKESSAQKFNGRFIQEGKRGNYRKECHVGSETDSRILGDDEFIDRVMTKGGPSPRHRVGLDRIIQEVCKFFSLQEGDFLVSGRDHKVSKARGMAAWLVMEHGTGTLGELIGRDVTTLSSAAKRLQIRYKIQNRLGFGREDDKAIRYLFLNCNIASLTPGSSGNR